MVCQQLRLTGVYALRQQKFFRIGIKNALRIAETAQQRQPGLIPQSLQLRQPHPVFQHVPAPPCSMARAQRL